MTTAVYVLEVDWNNDGDFGDANEDVTADVLSVQTKRGRDYASQLTGRAVAGRLEAVLKNPDGVYSSFNSASPIYGSILPGRKVRLRTTSPSAATLWTGYLERIVPAGTAGGYPTALLEASGPLSRINGRRISPAAQASAASGTIVGAILDAAGWPAGDRTIDTGQTTITRWHEDDADALDALREVEETEFGYAGESAAGNAVWEDRYHRLKSPHTTSQATYSDAAAAALPYAAIEQQDPLREIYNEVIASVEFPSAAGSNSVLWTYRGTNPTLTAGASLTLMAEYPNPAVGPDDGAYVDSWVTPVVGTDITQTGVANGDIAVSVTKNANSMEIVITNNHATDTATLTLVQARGDPVTRREPVRISNTDSTSQTAYGKRTYRLPGPWLPNITEALDFARYVVARYKDAHSALRLTLHANRSSGLMTEALTRDVSERVTVVATGSKSEMGINGDFFIEAVAHRITDGGTRHLAVLELSDAAGDGGWWVLNTSALATETRLAY